ncbi:hypothetical protein JCM14036_31470 [Desulfotomaculum defluvii]
MRKSRQLHLWIGLLTSFIILIESITGLLLLEPRLMGVNGPVHQQQRMKMEQAAMTTQGELQEESQVGRQLDPVNQGGRIMGFVKNIHKGKIGNTDVSFLMELMAVGLIILTITGMTMSIKILKAHNTRRNRRI